MATVIHYSHVTERWHVEEDEAGGVWTGTPEECQDLVEGFKLFAYSAAVVSEEGLEVENLPFGGSLVLVRNQSDPTQKGV